MGKGKSSWTGFAEAKDQTIWIRFSECLVHSPSPGEGGSAKDCPDLPVGAPLQTHPSLAMGNVILSHSFYSYSKWKTKISHWKNGFSDPIMLSVTGLCFPALRDLRWNCYICERMPKTTLKATQLLTHLAPPLINSK